MRLVEDIYDAADCLETSEARSRVYKAIKSYTILPRECFRNQLSTTTLSESFPGFDRS